jgi:hypothetical protein
MQRRWKTIDFVMNDRFRLIETLTSLSAAAGRRDARLLWRREGLSVLLVAG